MHMCGPKLSTRSTNSIGKRFPSASITRFISRGAIAAPAGYSVTSLAALRLGLRAPGGWRRRLDRGERRVNRIQNVARHGEGCLGSEPLPHFHHDVGAPALHNLLVYWAKLARDRRPEVL